MKRQAAQKFRRTCLAIALAGVFAPEAMAQTEQQAQKVEKIEVTGSSIRRVEGEGALPVTVISRAGAAGDDRSLGGVAVCAETSEPTPSRTARATPAVLELMTGTVHVPCLGP